MYYSGSAGGNNCPTVFVILKSVGNGGNKLCAARARLDNLGCVKSHCCFVNDPERLDRLKKHLQAASSLGDIEQAQKIIERRKRDEEECTLRSLFQQAVSVFRNGEHGSKFTKKHIKSIMLIAFGTSPKKVTGRRLNGSTK